VIPGLTRRLPAQIARPGGAASRPSRPGGRYASPPVRVSRLRRRPRWRWRPRASGSREPSLVVIAQAWYPTDATTGQKVPYFEAQGRLPSSIGGLPSFMFGSFGSVATHATVAAPVSAEQQTWPVLFFSTRVSHRRCCQHRKRYADTKRTHQKQHARRTATSDQAKIEWICSRNRVDHDRACPRVTPLKRPW
jgi:hypothetical protein